MRARFVVSVVPFVSLLSCADPVVGPTGPQGDPGAKGDPGPVGTLPAQLVGVLPSSVLSERAVRIQVSGLLTHFGTGTTLRFADPGISVTDLRVHSPTYLTATVQAQSGVRLGAHDLTVESAAVSPSGEPTTGKETVSLQAALVVAGTLGAEPSGNSKTVEQGGIVDWNVRSIDRDNALGSIVRTGGGARGLLLSALGGRVVGYGIVDALMPTGPLSLRLVSESPSSSLGFVLEPSGVSVPQVTARPATVLSVGKVQSGEKLLTGKQSNLYKLTTTTDSQLLMLSFAVEGGLLSSVLLGATAPATGRFGDGQFFYASTNLLSQTVLSYLPQKGDAYAAVLTTSLSGGGTYNVTAKTADVTVLNLKEPATPDSAAMPLVDAMLDGAKLGQGGAIDSAVDVDYVRLQVAKGGRLYVQVVTPGQGLSPSTLSVAIVGADCASPLSPSVPLRPVQQEAAAVAGQRYCAIISSPTGYVGPYQLLATQEL